MNRVDARLLLALATAAIAVAACGSSSSKPSSTTTGAAAAPTATATSTAAGPPPAVAELGAAQHPAASQFPTVQGHTLQQLAGQIKSTAQLGAATGTYVPGTRRFAFALTASSGAYVYAPTAVYLAKSPTVPAQGPFLAPADPMTVAPQYQSKQNAGPGGIQAIYETNVPLPAPGTYDVLAVTHGPHGLIGSTGEIAVAASSPIPDVGQRPPAIMTDTLATVHGDVSLLTTRQPPEQMHSVSFNQVLGKEPVALLFSTPQFCTSRVCGPVTDIVVSLQHEYAGRIAFIHQEVYADNQPSKGLRSQMKAFHLETEPWLFTVNRNGIIVARLEGAYGVNATRQALNAAIG